MMELSLAPGTGFEVVTAADLDRYLAAVASAGFGSVSLNEHQLAGDAAGAAKAIARHGLRCPDVMSLQITRREDETLQAARRLAHAAAEVGARHVLTLFYTRVNEESIDRFGRCGDLMVAEGARLALEMPPFSELDSIPAALATVDAVGRDRAALMIDTFHFTRGSSTWEQLEEFPLDALGYVQFDDALPAESDDVMHETMDRRAMPGDGEFDLTRFAGTLRGRGWSGLVSVEVLSAELRALEVEEFARRAYESTAPYWGL